VSPGFSDARYLREAGLDVYGFFPAGRREKISSMHAPDEHIHEQTLNDAYDMLYSIIAEVIQ
jgi:acetylornithine deacetylase/succinyl-diaminopimelate desuccinylase-like protein